MISSGTHSWFGIPGKPDSLSIVTSKVSLRFGKPQTLKRLENEIDHCKCKSRNPEGFCSLAFMQRLSLV
jgi:hypothetical protein